jgi:hypothetical protein
LSCRALSLNPLFLYARALGPLRRCTFGGRTIGGGLFRFRAFPGRTFGFHHLGGRQGGCRQVVGGLGGVSALIVRAIGLHPRLFSSFPFAQGIRGTLRFQGKEFEGSWLLLRGLDPGGLRGRPLCSGWALGW